MVKISVGGCLFGGVDSVDLWTWWEVVRGVLGAVGWSKCDKYLLCWWCSLSFEGRWAFGFGWLVGKFLRMLRFEGHGGVEWMIVCSVLG